MLIDNRDNIPCTPAAFRLAAHMPKDRPNRGALIPGAHRFADFLI